MAEGPLPAAVEVRGLRVRRGGRMVLAGLSLEIGAGSITGLVGPSGCGKSTLMRSIVGLQVVAGGSVRVLGLPAGSPPLRRRVGYSTQSPAVYPDLTVEENVRYFGAILGAPRSDTDRVLGRVGLQANRHQLAGRLSGGQLSRVSLAVALLGRPELLVLDEPTVGLDPVLRQELWRLFAELGAEGATLLVSSHVMDEAGRCQRLVFMREGEIVAHDTPDNLRQATGTQDLEDAFLRLIATREPRS